MCVEYQSTRMSIEARGDIVGPGSCGRTEAGVAPSDLRAGPVTAGTSEFGGAMRLRTAAASTLVIAALAVSTMGCEGRREVHLSDLTVVPSSWDTLRADVQFVSRTAIGAGVALTADTVVYRLFDSAFRTLYAGPGP